MAVQLVDSQRPGLAVSPVFVVGCDRSGTTLLTTLMESGLGLAVPLETHFIPYFAKTLFLWGNLEKRRNRHRLLQAIGYFLEILLIQAHPNKESGLMRSASLLAAFDDVDVIVDESGSYQTLIGGLFARFAAIQGKRGWVDNSSFYEPISLDVWWSHLPGMKVIHIVRDGRDVVLSWLQAWWGPASMGEAAQLWSDHVMDKRAWGLAHPGHYLEVCYETLLDDPKAVLAQIAQFLAIERAVDPLDWSASPTARLLSTGGTHDLLAGPILATNKEKWRQSMGTDAQRLFEYVAADTLQKCDYPTGALSFSFMERLQLGLQLRLSGVKRFFTLIYYAKKIKWLLPIVLWIAGPTGGVMVRFLLARKGGDFTRVKEN